MNKYFLLKDYNSALDDQEFEAEFIAEGHEILWQKQGDGFYLYENGEAVNDNSTPYWIEDIFLVAYKNKDYLLMDYNEVEENTIFTASLINDEMQVSWIKIKEHFYLIANTTLTLNYNGHFCNDDLVVYVDDLEAIMLLADYANCKDYTFYEATRITEKDQFVYRKGKDEGFYLYHNENHLHNEAAATYVVDDILAYIPEYNITLLFPNFRNISGEYFFNAEVLDNEITAFWSAGNDGFYLIDKGVNISAEVSNNNSIIGNHLLLFHPQTSTSYLFEDYLNRKDNMIRPAYILSRTANFVWAAKNNSYKLWYRGKRVGECEHQMMGNDLMVMPKSLQIMVQLKDFANCQDNRLRAVDSI